LDQKLFDVQAAMENQLRQTSLAQVVADAQNKLSK